MVSMHERAARSQTPAENIQGGIMVRAQERRARLYAEAS